MREQNLSSRQEYIEKTFGVETKLLKKIRETLKEDGKEGINVGANEGRILQMLVALSGAKKIVEVGCLYGYSALWMAEAIPDNGKLYTLELSEENANKAKSFFEESKHKNKINLLRGPAQESLKSLSKEAPFDMVFIDANKGGYMDYLTWAIENTKTGGLIIGDNTFLFGHVYGEGNPNMNVGKNPIETMKSFNETLACGEQFYSAILPTDEGMTVAVKR